MSSQELRAFRMRQIAEVLKEKMHLDERIVPRAATPGIKNNGKESPLSLKESLLSLGEEKISTSTPESEVHAAINPTDTANIVVGPMNISYPIETFRLTFPIYYTKNFGSTWSKSSFSPEPYEANATLSGGGDPLFAYDADGNLYMSWIDVYSTGNLVDSAGGWIIDSAFAGMYWASSTNGGQTWQRATNGYVGKGWDRVSLNLALDSIIVDSTTGLDDKEWMAVDRSNSQFHNSLYVAWTHLNYPDYGVMVRRKPAGVDSMLPPVQASPDTFLAVQFTSLGIDAQGGLHVTFMGTYDTIHYGIYTVYSSDGGATFGPPVKISDADIPSLSADAVANKDTIYGVRPVGNYPCPHLSIDTAGTGDLYEVWCALGMTNDTRHGTDIYISCSTDNGATWGTPTIINNDRDTEAGRYIDHFYPSIAVNGKGTITVTWYDRREDTNDVIGRYYLAQSTDRGQTWTNGPVATQPMDFSQVMDVNLNFGIGEYTQVLTTSNYTIPIWTDGRDDAGDLRIYAAFYYGSPLAGVERLSTVSEGLQLSPNYPNPFSSTTNLSFTQETAAHAELYVTNITGQRVASIYNGIAEAGEHDFTFDGSKLANGMYYLNLESDLGIVRQAMTILR
jgi:hypothetical protein